MSEPGENLYEHHDHTTTNQADSMEAIKMGSQLAQRIWNRYGYSPGVISMKTVRGIVSRVTRLSSGRLPLGADLQRRWVSSVSSGSSDPVSPGHIQPPTMNSVNRTLQSLPEKQVSEGAYQAHSLGAKNSTEFEPAIIRRHKSSITEQTIPRQVAPHVLASAAGDVPAHQEGIPLPQPSAAPIGSTSQMQTSTPIKRGIGTPEKIVLQRHLSNPPEQAGSHRESPREMSRPRLPLLERPTINTGVEAAPVIQTHRTAAGLLDMPLATLAPAGHGPYQDSPREMSRPRLPLLERPIMNTGVEATPVIQTHRTAAGPLDMPLATLAPAGHSTLIQAREETAPSAFATGPPPSAPATTHPAMETTGAPDSSIEQNNNDEQDLVDRVLRQLMRRLTIERERRGQQRWP